jgi:hypothetical protein
MTDAARRLGPVLAAAFVVRLVPVLLFAHLTVDVLRYHKVATHVLDVSWNPYQAPRLYPYPPLWVWVEAAAGALERLGLPFPIVIKLPVVLADLGIVALLAGWSARAAWIYALHPVSLLVTSFHGQFDALMLFFVLAALRAHEAGAHDRSALALAGAIATKSLPVLLLPFFWIALPPRLRPRLRFAALAVLPVALLLVPYALHDFGALRRELLGYGGVADFGWIGVVRGLSFLHTDRLIKAYPEAWGPLVPLAKLAFFGALGALLVRTARARPARPLGDGVLAALLTFLVFYGSISAQYLLWPIPLGARRAGVRFFTYSAAATGALVGFYAFLAPGVFFADEVTRPTASLWVAGAVATLAAAAWWWTALLRRGSAP